MILCGRSIERLYCSHDSDDESRIENPHRCDTLGDTLGDGAARPTVVMSHARSNSWSSTLHARQAPRCTTLLHGIGKGTPKTY